MEYLNEIKDLVTIARPVIDPLLTAFIKPVIEKISNLNKSKNIEKKFFEKKFEEYLARTYHNSKNINILIFQNQQIQIDDIYYPLTIESAKNQKKYRIESFKWNMLDPYKKILISDTAGMGKSTIMKWISLSIMENAMAIPILVELRNLREDNSVIDEIFNQLNPIDKSLDRETILKFLEMGNFVILFDGFDEIQLKNQEIIIKDLRNFINKATKNYFILTSRPEGALAAFGDFQLFKILPLKKLESFELIRKYDSICPIKIGEKLIADIEKNFNQTAELLENPFLVSLIYSTYTYNKDIPSTKVTFYEEIYSALYKRHDLSKDGWVRPKKSNLDIHQFKIMTRQLAFDTAILGEVAYNESELLDYIEKAKLNCPGLEFKVVDYFDDLLSAVPLMQRDGAKIKWAHKSLQDYFAADFIAFDSRKEEIVKKIYASNREGFYNIMSLYYELDYKTFRRIIIKSILEDFIKHYEETYSNVKDISNELIAIRKSETFEQIFILYKIPGRVKANDFFEEVSESSILEDKRIRSVRIMKDDLALASGYSFKRQLLEMVLEKDLAITTKAKFDPDYRKIEITTRKTLEINDNPDSAMNSKQNFKKINYLLASSRQKPEEIIDYNKAKTELEKIDKEILSKTSTKNFLGT